MGIGLFSQVTSNRMKENSLKVRQAKLRFDPGKTFFTKSVVNHQERLHRAVVESPFLETLKRCVDAALRDLD